LASDFRTAAGRRDREPLYDGSNVVSLAASTGICTDGGHGAGVDAWLCRRFFLPLGLVLSRRKCGPAYGNVPADSTVSVHNDRHCVRHDGQFWELRTGLRRVVPAVCVTRRGQGTRQLSRERFSTPTVTSMLGRMRYVCVRDEVLEQSQGPTPH